MVGERACVARRVVGDEHVAVLVRPQLANNNVVHGRRHLRIDNETHTHASIVDRMLPFRPWSTCSGRRIS